MNQELRDKMIVFNRKARAAKLDGYAVIAGKVMEPKPVTPWEMREVCDVEDYTSTDEMRAVNLVVRGIEELAGWEPGKPSRFGASRNEIRNALAEFQHDLVHGWGWTWEQVERHEAACMELLGQ